MRACHPASNLADRVLAKGVSTPHRPAFMNGMGLVAGKREFRKALQMDCRPFTALREARILHVCCLHQGEVAGEDRPLTVPFSRAQRWHLS